MLPLRLLDLWLPHDPELPVFRATKEGSGPPEEATEVGVAQARLEADEYEGAGEPLGLLYGLGEDVTPHVLVGLDPQDDGGGVFPVAVQVEDTGSITPDHPLHLGSLPPGDCWQP